MKRIMLAAAAAIWAGQAKAAVVTYTSGPLNVAFACYTTWYAEGCIPGRDDIAWGNTTMLEWRISFLFDQTKLVFDENGMARAGWSGGNQYTPLTLRTIELSQNGGPFSYLFRDRTQEYAGYGVLVDESLRAIEWNISLEYYGGFLRYFDSYPDGRAYSSLWIGNRYFFFNNVSNPIVIPSSPPLDPNAPSPIPLPATAPLLLLGAAGLGMMRWRQARGA